MNEIIHRDGGGMRWKNKEIKSREERTLETRKNARSREELKILDGSRSSSTIRFLRESQHMRFWLSRNESNGVSLRRVSVRRFSSIVPNSRKSAAQLWSLAILKRGQVCRGIIRLFYTFIGIPSDIINIKTLLKQSSSRYLVVLDGRILHSIHSHTYMHIPGLWSG